MELAARYITPPIPPTMPSLPIYIRAINATKNAQAEVTSQEFDKNKR